MSDLITGSGGIVEFRRDDCGAYTMKGAEGYFYHKGDWVR